MILQNSDLFSAHLISPKVPQPLDSFLVDLLILNLLGHPTDQVVLNKLKVVLFALSPPLAEFFLVDLDILWILLFFALSSRCCMFMPRFFVAAEQFYELAFNYIPGFEIFEKGLNCGSLLILIFFEYILIYHVGALLNPPELFRQILHHFVCFLKLIEVLEIFVGLVSEIKFEGYTRVNLENALKSDQIFFTFEVNYEGLCFLH